MLWQNTMLSVYFRFRGLCSFVCIQPAWCTGATPDWRRLRQLILTALDEGFCWANRSAKLITSLFFCTAATSISPTGILCTVIVDCQLRLALSIVYWSNGFRVRRLLFKLRYRFLTEIALKTCVSFCAKMCKIDYAEFESRTEHTPDITP